MSELYPLPRSVREDDFLSSEGQTEFGPPDWTLFDAADVLVYVKPAGGQVFGLVDAEDYTVDPLDPEFPSKFRIVFDVGRAAGDVVRIKGARAHERLTNVTQAGAIRAVPLETELDRIGVVLQELRRDNDRSVNLLTDAENAAAVAEAARDAAQDAQADAEAAETGSEDARDAAMAWATEAEDTPVDDGVNPQGFSAFHWSQKASIAALAAAMAAAGVNLPPIQAGDAGKTLVVNQNENGYQLFGGNVLDTKAALEARDFGGNAPSAVLLFGYNAAGDGGCAHYRHADAEPDHAGKIQSADGDWWELAEKEVCPEMFGGFPASGDVSSAVQAALDFPHAHVLRLWGLYAVSTGLVLDRPHYTIRGYSNDFVNASTADQCGFISGDLIDILTVRGSAPIYNLTFDTFNILGAGARAGQDVKGLVIGAGGVSVTDGAISSGSTTFTSASANFTDADIGKNLRVTGAGAGGGNLLTVIVSVNSATSVEVGLAASTTVSGASAHWVFNPVNVRLMGVTTSPLHWYGVHVETCANLYVGGHSKIQGNRAGLRVESFFHGDSGDHIVSDSVFTADPALGSCLELLSGGSIKISNCKTLHGLRGFYFHPNNGSLANLGIANCSMEGHAGSAIQLGPGQLQVRVDITGNTTNANRFLNIPTDTSLNVDLLTVTGNSIQKQIVGDAGTPIAINRVTKFIIANNVIDCNQEAGAGISIGATAEDGIIGPHVITGFTGGSAIINSGTNVDVMTVP